jgi:hypothetical protein
LTDPFSFRRKVWILLDPRYPLHFKQVPSDSFVLTSNDWKRIEETKTVSEAVLLDLRKRVIQISAQ